LREADKFIVCYVTDRRSLESRATPNAEASLRRRIEDAVKAGVDWVQIREKDLPARNLTDLTRGAIARAAIDAKERAAAGRTRVLVNDRLDVAWAAAAAGVHAGESSLPIRELAEARRRLGREDFLVGASCHSLKGVLRAAEDGADYVFFGPVFATPSKAGFGAPQGLTKLAEACEAVSIPVIAIGGITVENAGACGEAGAAGIAAIRLFQQSANAAEIVGRLRGR
jgi:thiamine-phosphate pyrophosphorylase